MRWSAAISPGSCMQAAPSGKTIRMADDYTPSRRRDSGAVRWQNGGVRSMALAALLVLSGLALGPDRAAAAPPPAQRVRVELLSEVDAVVPGRTFWIALSQRIEAGWHTYWINPGDSGEPIGIEWQAPAGFTVGDIAWPHPERIRVGPAMSFGYSDRVVLPIPVTAPADLAPGRRVTLRGQAHWLVCEKT